MGKLIIFLVLAYGILDPVFAQTEACAHGDPRSLSVGMSSSARPYIFPERDSGIQVEIVEQALREVGYQLCPVYLPLSRATQQFARGMLDGLLNVTASHHHGFLSDVVLEYRNCLYSLRRHQRNLQSLQDLENHSWQPSNVHVSCYPQHLRKLSSG